MQNDAPIHQTVRPVVISSSAPSSGGSDLSGAGGSSLTTPGADLGKGGDGNREGTARAEGGDMDIEQLDGEVKFGVKGGEAGEMEDVDDTWPPPVLSKMQPVALPFGPRVPRVVPDLLAHQDGIEEEESNMIYFMQFPSRLPFNPPTTANAAGGGGASGASAGAPPSSANAKKSGSSSVNAAAVDSEGKEAECAELKKLGSGHMGKLRIHRSGKVTLLLGECELEVAAGLPCHFVQEVVSVSTSGDDDDTYCQLGSITKRLVCTPSYS